MQSPQQSSVLGHFHGVSAGEEGKIDKASMYQTLHEILHFHYQ